MKKNSDSEQVWKRWVRFKAADGSIYGGEPVDADVDGNVNCSSSDMKADTKA